MYQGQNNSKFKFSAIQLGSVVLLFAPILGLAAAQKTAAPAENSLSLNAQLPETKKPFMSVETDLSVDSDLKDRTQSEHEQSLSLVVTPAMNVSENSKFSIRAGFVKKTTQDEAGDFDNTILTWAHNPIHFGEGINNSVSFSALAYLPTNKDDRENATFRGGTGATLSYSHVGSILNKESTLKLSLSALKNYHEFEQSNEYKQNLSHRIRYIFTHTQSFTKIISTEIVARYQTGWTYSNALRTAFLISETVNFALDDQWSVYLAHTNEGDALTANGTTSNIDYYDAQHSVISLGVTATY